VSDVSTLERKESCHFGSHVCGIYMFVNLVNNKKYIGQSHNIGKRITQHKINAGLNDKRGQTYLSHAIRKYGMCNFKIEIIHICHHEIEQSELDSLEIFYIKKYNSSNQCFGYNTTQGGGGGLMTDIARARFIESIHTEECKAKKSKNLKQRWASNRERMLDANKKALETRIRNAEQNPKPPKQPKILYGPRLKNVVCIEKQCTYESITEAADAGGTRPSTIYANCQGNNISAGAYHYSWPRLDGAYSVRDRAIRAHEITNDKRMEYIERSIALGQAKPIKCIESNIVYRSAGEAAIKLNIKVKTIRQHLHDKKRQPSVNHLHFEFV